VAIVETVLRLVLKLHMPGVALVRFMPASRSCLLEHGDGTVGAVPSSAVLALEMARHVR